MAAGSYNVTVAAGGFAVWTANVTTGVLNQAPVAAVLKVAQVTSTIEVTPPPKELAVEQLKSEEKQRVLGVFPHFLVTYDPNAAPLTARQKFHGVVTGEYPIPSPSVSPAGIVSGPDGALWFVEVDGNGLGRLTTAGQIDEFPVPTSGSRPFEIIAGSDGGLWFSEYGGNKIAQAIYPAAPVITSVNTASGGDFIAQNAWIEIRGFNLVPATTPASGVIWNTAPSFASGQMPTQLGGVSVKVDTLPAYVYFFCSAATSPVCTKDQINVLTPLDPSLGEVPVVVTKGTLSAPEFTVTMKTVVPTFLLFDPIGHVVATHADNTLVGPASLFPGYSTPAKPGEPVVLYGVGFGLPATPLTRGSALQSGVLPALPACHVGKMPAAVTYAALISPGLYQLNLTVPLGTTTGENEIGCNYGSSDTGAFVITVQQ